MRKERNFSIYSREFFYAQFFVLKFLTKITSFYILVRKPEDFSLFTLTLAKCDTPPEPIHACTQVIKN